MLSVDSPILEKKISFKGFLSGSIIGSSTFLVLSSVNVFLTGLLLILGILVFLDAIIPYGRMPAIGSVIFFAILGMLISFVFYYFQRIGLFAFFAVAAVVSLYTYTFFRKKDRKTWV